MIVVGNARQTERIVQYGTFFTVLMYFVSCCLKVSRLNIESKTYPWDTSIQEMSSNHININLARSGDSGSLESKAFYKLYIKN